jgi:hypothetical protein
MPELEFMPSAVIQIIQDEKEALRLILRRPPNLGRRRSKRRIHHGSASPAPKRLEPCEKDWENAPLRRRSPRRRNRPNCIISRKAKRATSSSPKVEAGTAGAPMESATFRLVWAGCPGMPLLPPHLRRPGNPAP